MILKNGATYRFLSREAESDAGTNGKGRSLNVYGTQPTSLANVCLYTSDDSDICQQWVYVEDSDGLKYLKCKGNMDLALDLYTGASSVVGVRNCNAHVFEPSETSCIEVEDAGGGYIYIRLSDDLYRNKYLAANAGVNGTNSGKSFNSDGNVYFVEFNEGDPMPAWKPILLADPNPEPIEPEPGAAQYLALPLNKCKITAMYKDDSNPAYQHEWSTNGHFGLDMVGMARPFYASGNGTVVGVGGGQRIGVGYWAAIRYDNVYSWNMENDNLQVLPSIIVRYYHLLEKPSLTEGQKVTLDTLIGSYDRTGAWYDSMKEHLHVEVDTDIKNPLHTPTLGGNVGGLYAGNRGTGDTTIDPCTVFFVKTSAPENQTLDYVQSYCDKHKEEDIYEPYINEDKMKIFARKVIPG